MRLCWIAFLVSIIICCVMMVTGYMPFSGFGHSASHALRYGEIFGIACGALLGLISHRLG